MPLATRQPPEPEVKRSKFLSLMARPGDGSIAGRKVAIVVGPGVDGAFARQMQQALLEGGAVGRFVGMHIGPVDAGDGSAIDADASTENSPGFLFDALVIPDGNDGLKRDGHLWEFVRDAYRHCKPIVAIGDAREFVTRVLPDGADTRKDKALILDERGSQGAIDQLIQCLGAPRDFSRESDPPRV